MRRIDLYITDPQYAALAEILQTDGLTISEQVRRGIDDYLSARKRRLSAEEDRQARKLQAEFIESLRQTERGEHKCY